MRIQTSSRSLKPTAPVSCLPAVCCMHLLASTFPFFLTQKPRLPRCRDDPPLCRGSQARLDGRRESVLVGPRHDRLRSTFCVGRHQRWLSRQAGRAGPRQGRWIQRVLLPRIRSCWSSARVSGRGERLRCPPWHCSRKLRGAFPSLARRLCFCSLLSSISCFFQSMLFRDSGRPGVSHDAVFFSGIHPRCLTHPRCSNPLFAQTLSMSVGLDSFTVQLLELVAPLPHARKSKLNCVLALFGGVKTKGGGASRFARWADPAPAAACCCQRSIC